MGRPGPSVSPTVTTRTAPRSSLPGGPHAPQTQGWDSPGSGDSSRPPALDRGHSSASSFWDWNALFFRQTWWDVSHLQGPQVPLPMSECGLNTRGGPSISAKIPEETRKTTTGA